MAKGSGKTRPVELDLKMNIEDLSPQQQKRWLNQADRLVRQELIQANRLREEAEKKAFQKSQMRAQQSARMKAEYAENQIKREMAAEVRKFNLEKQNMKARHVLYAAQERNFLMAIKERERRELASARAVQRATQRAVMEERQLRRGGMMSSLTTGFVVDRMAGFAGAMGDRIIQKTGAIGRNLYEIASSFEYIKAGIGYAFGARSDEVWKKSLENAQTMNISTREVLDTVRSLGVLKIDPFSKMANPHGGAQTALKSLSDLAALVPQQGMQGALFAIRNALSGQWRSLQMRFDIPKSMIDEIRKKINNTMSDQVRFDAIMQGITDHFGGMMRAVENTSKFHLDNIKDIFTNIIYDVTQGSNKLITPFFKKISDWLIAFRKDDKSIVKLSKTVMDVTKAVMEPMKLLFWMFKQLAQSPFLLKVGAWFMMLGGPLLKLVSGVMRLAVGFNLLRISAMQAGGTITTATTSINRGISTTVSTTRAATVGMAAFGAAMKTAMSTTAVGLLLVGIGALITKIFAAKEAMSDLKNIQEGWGAEEASTGRKEAWNASMRLSKKVNAIVSLQKSLPGATVRDFPQDLSIMASDFNKIAELGVMGGYGVPNIISKGKALGLETNKEGTGFTEASIRSAFINKTTSPKMLALANDISQRAIATANITGVDLTTRQSNINLRGKEKERLIAATKDYSDQAGIIASTLAGYQTPGTKPENWKAIVGNVTRLMEDNPNISPITAAKWAIGGDVKSGVSARQVADTVSKIVGNESYVSGELSRAGRHGGNISSVAKVLWERTADIPTETLKAKMEQFGFGVPKNAQTGQPAFEGPGSLENIRTMLGSSTAAKHQQRMIDLLESLNSVADKTEENTEETAANTKKVEELLPPIFREIFDKFTRRGMLSTQGRVAFLNTGA